MADPQVSPEASDGMLEPWPGLSMAAWAPAGALLVGAAGFAGNGFSGDIRAGAFPFSMAAAFAMLAWCAQGVLRVHDHRTRGIVVGGWWSTLALLGPAGFFLAAGVGALLGVDEESLGGIAILPVAGMAFGILTLPLAASILAVAAHRAGRLPSRSIVALAIAGWVPPLLMIFGGLAEGTLESRGSAALAAIFAAAWIVVGHGLRSARRWAVPRG